MVAIIDYGIGNMRSAQKSLERAGADARLTGDLGLISDAAGVVLPGVGHFQSCMGQLRSAGLADMALGAVESDRPFLGICVGMQMLFEGSEEAPGVEGLGVFPGLSRRIETSLPLPHMQWNRLDVARPKSALLDGMDGEVWMYFVHSYSADTEDEFVVATAEYEADVTAMVQRGDSVWATQFHPEKSGDRGLRLITNFVTACASDEEAPR
ncbi:MAG: imidazole glycerol phosphate synthase subunit HisH [Actinomycetia bacterium]|nr:imidazole glycerol phosphate synthase subunit HisH [Actinomycetes bacterium]MCP4957636.1 imidazole glycerol phosphate synthase subunit HisH [Actinomycetes bacterium]